MRIESTILRNLLYNEDYARKVMPFIESEYFHDRTEKMVYEEIFSHMENYNTLPTREVISIAVGQGDKITDEEYTKLIGYVDKLEQDEPVDNDWLVDETERFCKDKSLYNAIMESIQIYDDKTKDKTVESIPELVGKALSISFDPDVGHDFLDDSDERFDYYHRKEDKVPFDLELMNKITKGGLSKKSLNIVMAGTGVGKSLFMCHCAAGNLTDGKNVLYITMEMAEERIAERIDANLLNVSMEDLRQLPKDLYDQKIESVQQKTVGKLIIKEYPTASAHVGHFRHLLNELRLKRSFTPDIIYIDYLNICSSSRLKLAANLTSYTYVKAIAEEIRGLAVESDVPIMSATQTNREGYSNTDVDLTDTSESFGLPATADFMIAIISTEDLDNLDQIAVKQLKNRYNDPTVYKKFVVGLDRSKMRLYDVEDNAQGEIVDSGIDEDLPMTNGFSKSRDYDFEGIQL